jgi:DNA invertase Pin-like site-specific DNA recombinase
VLARHGCYVVMIEQDSKEGDNVSRKGYQKIKKAVQQGIIEAVGVYKMSRWGRSAVERLRVGEEFDKLRVPIFDAQRGKADTPGLERVIFAGIDEQFLRDLSWTITRAMPAAAKDGKHLGPTPIGYKRVYPAGEVVSKRPCAELVPDPLYAPVVVQVFERYARGESAHAISRWLNTLPDRPNPKHKKTGLWSAHLVSGMLRRRAYIGEVDWGHRHVGKYNQYEGTLIQTGVDGVPAARHKPIIERPLWDRVQERLSGTPERKQVTQRGTTSPLLAGVLRCAGCGGPTTPWRASDRPEGNGRYRCSGRQLGTSSCPEPAISMPVADAAVLREVARLRGTPWEPPALERLMNRDPQKAERQRLTAELAAAERDLQANVVAFRALGDLSEAAVTAFRRDAQTIDTRIKSLKSQLDALPRTSTHLDEVKQLQDPLRRTTVAEWITQAAGDVVALRRILGGFIRSATLVERVASGPSGRTAWARAEVEWSPSVQVLLEEGLLTLDPAPETPVRPSPKERAAERARRYRARKRAEQEQD